MKKRVMGGLLVLIWLGAVGTARAQSRTGDLKGSVPFPFVAANQTLPAGKYTISPLGETVFRIYSASNTGVLVQTNSAEQKESASVTKMIFRRYGNTYLLSEFWIAGHRIGRQVFRPAAEKERESQNAAEVAVLLSAR